MTYLSNPTVTDWQRQIIIGTVLGGSSLVRPKRGRNCYLAMRSHDRKWLAYKASELAVFASSQVPFREERHTLRWHSSCYPIFSEVRQMLYDEAGERVLKMETLDILQDIGLAVWFLDRGKLVRNKVILNTFMFGEAGTTLAVQYFNEIGVEADVYRERGKPRVRLTARGTMEFLATIAHRVPPFMLRRIGGTDPTEGRTPSPAP